MATVIAVANQKGGVGKTTTVVSLSAALTECGHRVLAVDLDPQTSLTAATLGERAAAGLDGGLTVFEALCEGNPVGAAPLQTAGEGFAVLPGSYNLVGAERLLAASADRERRLSSVLRPLEKSFDFILLDCPPGLGLLMLNALTAARWVLIPVAPRYFDMRGLATIFDTIERVQKSLNPRLEILGILVTLLRKRSRHRREVVDILEDQFHELLFEQSIPEAVAFWEAPGTLTSILHYAPDSPGAAAYRRVAEEVIARVGS